MNAPRVLGTSATIAAAISMACAACHRAPPSSDGHRGLMVVTQVRKEKAWEGGCRLSPDRRYPRGSRVALVSAAKPEELRVLSRGLAAAGAPEVSPGADAVVFAGKKTPDAPWALFELQLGDRRPRAVIETDRDCIDPAYLPRDRLVFACRDVPAGSSWSLYVASRHATGMERISFGPASDFDPTALRDGRILFSRWQGEGLGRQVAGAVGLLTVNPDGTLLEAFTGSHTPPVLKARARETRDGGVVFLSGPGAGAPFRVERVEMRRPLATRREVPLGPVEGLAGNAGVMGVEALPGGGLLFTSRVAVRGESEAPETWGVYRLAPGSGVERVFDSPEWNEVEAVPLLTAPEPRGRPSAVDRRLSRGALICYDATRSDSVSRSLPVATAVIEAYHTGTPSSIWLGEAPLEKDGSFYVEVPADVPLRVRTLTTDGQEMATSAWFWVRPGEVRACFGCHESREQAPVNRHVEALFKLPRRLPENVPKELTP